MQSGSHFDVTVLRDVTLASLTEALSQEVTACVERGAEPALAGLTGDLILVLSTATAFSIDIGTLFVDALVARKLLPEHRRKDLRLALHEALANGLLHGNLELASHATLTPEEFLNHAALMEQRLALPDFGQRPIVLAASLLADRLEVAISDRGAGFVPQQVASPGRLAGRGLRLMAAHSDDLRHEDGGRRVVLGYVGLADDA